MGSRSPLGFVLACLTFVFCLAASQSEAQTRRAFLVGVQRYSDGYINPLTRAVNDAKDLGKDLEDAGFDKKNIKALGRASASLISRTAANASVVSPAFTNASAMKLKAMARASASSISQFVCP